MGSKFDWLMFSPVLCVVVSVFRGFVYEFYLGSSSVRIEVDPLPDAPAASVLSQDRQGGQRILIVFTRV